MADGIDSARMERPDRIAYFDLLRLIAAAAVITIHTVTDAIHGSSVFSEAWSAANVYNSLARWAVPVFVMISGALFLDPERPFDRRRFFRRHVLRLIVIYGVWSLLYAVVYTCFVKRDGWFLLPVRFVSGHYHLWFLLMILCLYLATPLLRLFTRRREDAAFFLGLALLFTFLIPTAAELLRVTGTSFIRNDLIASAGQKLMWKANFHFTLGFTPYFVGGYYLHTARIGRKQEALVYLLGLAGLAATAGISAFASRLSGVLDDRFYEFDMLHTMCVSAAVFVFAKQRLRRLASRPWVKAASKLSFGVYLVHVFVLDALRACLPETVLSHPWAGTPLTVCAVLALSMEITWCLKRIPVIGGYLL